jgi:tetratricopeptide (TPR) repeat protein
MSFLGKLIGRKTAAEEEQRAAELFARDEFGLAKLAYERALDRTSDALGAERERLKGQVDACCDALAKGRIAEAERLLLDGAIDLAEAELQNAAETAASADLVADVQRRLDAIERREAREGVVLAAQSQDDHFETIAGNWEEDQYDEYASHGDELQSALSALYGGEAERALPLLEAALAASEKACYLWFETGRARLLNGRTDAGREALERFIATLGAGEGGEARLVAHMELAALHHEQHRFDAAVAEYQAAIEALPDDPRPYLAMAVFFRREKLAEEAVDVLEAACNMLEQADRPWRLTAELALAKADLGQAGEARELLEEVIARFTTRQNLDLPAEYAIRLAGLHEQAGNKARALDLYHLLARGSDVPNHCAYYRKAGALMLELGHRADARRMLQRAAEVAPDDPAVRAEIAQELAQLA